MGFEAYLVQYCLYVARDSEGREREMDMDVFSDVSSGAAMTALFFYVLSGKIHPGSAILSSPLLFSFWKILYFYPLTAVLHGPS